MSQTEEKSPKQDQRGLAGQVIGETSVCAVNQTQLMYRGYEIADLAANATFEEVAHVLLVGHKPSSEELAAFKAELASMRAIPNSVKDAIIHIANNAPTAHPMAVLRTAVSLLSHLSPLCEDNNAEADLKNQCTYLPRYQHASVFTKWHSMARHRLSQTQTLVMPQTYCGA